MKKGDIVTIYHDPITCSVPEGQARLMRDLKWSGRGFFFEGKSLKKIRWTVQFLDTGDKVDRFIVVDKPPA